MTTAEYKTRRAELDASDEKAAAIVVSVGCIAITLAWVGLLAHLWVTL